ncbi:MAG: hypothetical protein LBR19_03555 [Bifidobacteriaceae bacterium]|nr:hypothetical protein [Bifidobacteriaceae bacterium]
MAKHVARTGQTKSHVISLAVDEWLRLQGHPRIRFVEPVPGERRAALVDGPEVWSVAEAWIQNAGPDRTAAMVAATIGLRTDQVEAALAYWADNRDEIDGLVTRVQADQEAAFLSWQRRQALEAV